MKSFKQFFSENIGGIFKNASEWEKSAKARGLVVKSMTHPSGEMTKYQIAKDKEGNNRGHFDHGTKSGHLKEEVEQIDESEVKYVVKGKSPFYKQDHYINTHETPKAQLIKKNIKHATRMDLETAKKVAKDWESHPNKYKTEVVPVNEEVELDEVSASTLRSYIDKSRADKKAAMKDRTAAEKNIRTYGGMKMDKKERDDASRRVVNRSQGISVANQKLGTYPKDKIKPKVMAREEVELDEAKLERNTNTVGAHHLERDSGDHKMYTAYTGSLVRRLHTVTDKDDNILGQATSAAAAMAKAKLKKAHRDALMHDDNQIVKVHDTRGSHNVGTQVSTPGKGKWFKDHEEAMKYAKSLPGKIRYADPKTGHVFSEEVELDEAKKPKPGHNAAVMAKNISKVLAAIKK